MKNTRVTTAVFAALILGMPLLPVLAQNHGGHADQQDQKMTMSGMMECQKSCDGMSASMADLMSTIEAARKSDDLPILHAALDQVQTGLAKMEGEMKARHAKMQQSAGR